MGLALRRGVGQALAVNVATILQGHPDDAVALVVGGEVTTYGALRSDVDRLRAGLVALGVVPGDRVAVVSQNDRSFVLSYLAAAGAGAIVVPVNPSSPARELEGELALVRPVALVVGPGAPFAAEVDAGRAGGTIRHVLTATGVEVPGATPLDELGASDAGGAAVVERAPDDPAVLMFTAGTSGGSRAAVLTHANLLTNCEQLQRHPGRAMRPTDVSLGVLPMFHIFGLNVVLGLTLFAGGSVVILPEFHPREALAVIRQHAVTILSGAPTMYAALAAVADASADDLRSVRLAVSGASKLAPETAAAFEARFGIPIYEGYGLTEASPVVTSSVLDAPPKPGSIGVPIPGEEVRIVDDEGDDVPLGDAGELWVRGPNVFAGYWEDAAATAAVLTPTGWLRTGDVAVLDDDGEIHLVDRAKDIIIVNGFNVYPIEVEEALVEHPGVAEVAVVGVEDARTGEAVHAYVVPRDGASPTAGELAEFCGRRLARYKCPAEISLVPSLPYGMAGKLLRRELRRSSR